MIAADAVTLRHAAAGDARAIAALAGAHPAGARLLVAEIEGELRAALSLDDGSVLADPIRPSADALELLRAWALQLEDAQAPRRRWRPRRRRLVAPCV